MNYSKKLTTLWVKDAEDILLFLESRQDVEQSFQQLGRFFVLIWRRERLRNIQLQQPTNAHAH